MVWRQEFASLGEFLRFCKDAPSDIPHDKRQTRTLKNNDSWTGYVDFEGAVKLASEGGWSEGRDRASRITDVHSDKIGTMLERPEWHYDVEGPSLDVARYLDGEPECWLTPKMVLTDGPSTKLLRVVVNVSAASGISTDVMISKGAVSAALVELLELAGHRVELSVVFAASELKDRGDRVETIVRLKRFDDAFDHERFVFALAHPASLRVLAVTAWETLPKEARVSLSIPGRCGFPADVHETDRGDIYIGRTAFGEDQWTNPSKAQQWIIARLAEQDVKLKTGEAV